MANVNAPSGLAPVQYLNGSPWSGQARMYCIPDTDDTLLYAIGDPVTLAGGADSRGIPTITLATAGTSNPVLGPIVSMGATKYGASAGDPNLPNATVIPATKDRNYYVLVVDDPNVIFEAQEDGTSTTFVAADVGLNINLVSGVNNGFLSGWLLDSTPTATTATLQCQLLMLAQRQNNAMGQYAKWWVRINNHCYKAGVAGV